MKPKLAAHIASPQRSVLTKPKDRDPRKEKTGQDRDPQKGKIGKGMDSKKGKLRKCRDSKRGKIGKEWEPFLESPKAFGDPKGALGRPLWCP